MGADVQDFGAESHPGMYPISWTAVTIIVYRVGADLVAISHLALRVGAGRGDVGG